MLSTEQWNKLSGYCREKVISELDPSVIAMDRISRAELNIKHKGFYIGVIDPEDNELARSGFLKSSENIKDSAEISIKQTVENIRSLGIPISKLHTSSFFFTLVSDVVYLENPLSWNEESEGIYFQWGQDFKGFYLPYQIKRMGIDKVEILDRLCSWESGVASNLWRLPEGLCWSIKCSSHQA